MKISPEEAFLTLRKWQVEQRRVLLVGSLMPNHPLRGTVTVVTREGTWNSGTMPPSRWGFSLTGKTANFLASTFENFEYLQPAELPPQIRISLQSPEPDRRVLAFTNAIELPRAGLVSVSESLYLIEDDAHTVPEG